MNVLFPIKNGIITQRYSDGSDNPFYKSLGLASHAGVDIVSFHGDKILACEDMRIWKVLDASHGSVTKGFGVYGLTLPDNEGICRNWLFWHTMSNIPVKEGQFVTTGQSVALEGDSGSVFVGGIAVPDNQKGKPPYPGTHLHWGVQETQRTRFPASDYLLNKLDGTPYSDSEGYFYKILNYENGNKGFINPMLYDIIYDRESNQALEVVVLTKLVDLYKKLISLLTNK